jgi:hypothetical protein
LGWDWPKCQATRERVSGLILRSQSAVMQDGLHGRPKRQRDMQQLSRVWESVKASFFEKPVSWVLFALLCVTAYQWYAESSRLEGVCVLAREAIDITTPTPDDPASVLKQVERPSTVNGYSLRELWRWQQLDGPQIEDLCS